MKYIKKNWSNILFAILIILMFIPQTRTPIQVFLLRAISYTPSQIDEKERAKLDDYHWELSSLSSEQVYLNRSQGKVTLISFWATWCAPCIAELPFLQKLYENYGDRVDFYFVSNEEKGTLLNFLKKKEFDLPVYIPLERSPELLEIRSLPTTFLIAKSGEIVIRETGAASWNNEKVHELLDELLDQ